MLGMVDVELIKKMDGRDCSIREISRMTGWSRQTVRKIVAGEGVTVGPILLGAARPVHILTPTSSVRRIVNMTALTAVDAAIQI